MLGSKPPSFPVWKRGSIASEPDLVRLTTWSIPPPPRHVRLAGHIAQLVEPHARIEHVDDG